MSIRNSLLRTYFARRMKAIDRFRRHPDQVQAEMFRQLIARGPIRSSVVGTVLPSILRPRRSPHGSECRTTRVSSLISSGCWPERRMSLPRAGDAFRPFVGNYVRPQQIHSRHAGVRVVEPYARYAGRGGGVCFGQAADEDLRRQDADARRFVCPGERSSHRGSVGCADQPDSVLERLVPGAEDGDGSDSGFRPEDRGSAGSVPERRSRPLPACLRGTWC